MTKRDKLAVVLYCGKKVVVGERESVRESERDGESACERER